MSSDGPAPSEMTLDHYLQTVQRSRPGAWATMEARTVADWTPEEGSDEDRAGPTVHTRLAVLKADVDVSVAWGAVEQAAFQEPWTRPFADPSASMIRAEFRYRGAPVHLWRGVRVDGGRTLLPLPDRDGRGGYVVAASALALGRLMFGLNGSGGAAPDLDGALAIAGVPIR